MADDRFGPRPSPRGVFSTKTGDKRKSELKTVQTMAHKKNPGTASHRGRPATRKSSLPTLNLEFRNRAAKHSDISSEYSESDSQPQDRYYSRSHDKARETLPGTDRYVYETRNSAFSPVSYEQNTHDKSFSGTYTNEFFVNEIIMKINRISWLNSSLHSSLDK